MLEKVQIVVASWLGQTISRTTLFFFVFFHYSIHIRWSKQGTGVTKGQHHRSLIHLGSESLFLRSSPTDELSLFKFVIDNDGSESNLALCCMVKIDEIWFESNTLWLLIAGVVNIYIRNTSHQDTQWGEKKSIPSAQFEDLGNIFL